mgnify:FL=1
MGHKKQYIKKMVRANGYNPEEMASCYGKVRYQNIQEAKEQAALLSYRDQVVYKCKFCRFYHIGRRPKK